MGNIKILEGIRVVECASVFNGPVTAYMLGDLGAEVIKVEPPVTGDQSRGMSSIYDIQMVLPGGRNSSFEAANRNKKDIVLNLKSEEGQSIFYKLIQKSDIFITNYLPKSLKNLKIDWNTLKQVNPKLIYAKTSTFGSKGPLRDRSGYDMSGQAYSGAMWISGDRDYQGPSVVVGSVFDQISASTLAYGVLAALVARERFKIGQEVECSLLGSAIHMQAMNISPFLWAGRGMARFSQKRCRNPLTNYYRCADDKWILLTEPQSAKYWHDFCTAMGMEEMENDSRFSNSELRRKNYAELITVLDHRFATKPRDEWLKAFSSCDFAYAPIYEYADVVNDPQVIENGYVVETEHSAMGKIKVVGSPVQFSETPTSIQSRPPEFGEHTEEVLTELLGYSWEEVESMRNNGTLG